MQDFKKLYAWQRSHALAVRTYAISTTFPKGEMFGLTSQVRRAAVSIAANIAEGACRGGNRAFAQSLRIALGSAGELEYYVILASDLKLIPPGEKNAMHAEVAEVKRMIAGLLKSVMRN